MYVETQRLILRPIRVEEAEIVASLITENIHNWTALVPWPYSVADAQKWLSVTEETGRLGLYLKPQNILVGTIRAPLVDEDEIGFWINDEFANQGLMSEAAEALVEHVFAETDITNIKSSVHVDNTPSIRIHEKLGFELLYQTEHYWKNKERKEQILVYSLDK